MIRKEDVIAIARKAYAAGGEDAKNGVHCDCEECKYPLLDMVSEALADCENYNEKLN